MVTQFISIGLCSLFLSLTSVLAQENNLGKEKIYTFLTFQKGNAEQAMNFYIDLFDDSELISIQRWGKDAPSKEGTIMHATFSLSGSLYMCSDSPPIHNWDFTPAISNYVQCDSEVELEKLFSAFAQDGTIFMPINNYGFSEKFGWVQDRFGISWQLNYN